MTNFSSRLSVLSLGVSLFVGGCWVAPEPLPPDQDPGNCTGGWGGNGGYGGKAGHSGTGGYAGVSGSSGTGGWGGSGGYAGTGGYAGWGGSGGKAGGGGEGGLGGSGGFGGGDPFPLPDAFTLSGGDIDEEHELFPFGVAVSDEGAVFVSTLGNRDNEPSRIYRFAPGTTSNPEILFEVGNAEDAAVYGLTFDHRGRLYACVSSHLHSANPGVVVPSILRFEAEQTVPFGEPLGPANVQSQALRSAAINVGGSFVISDEVSAGGCGQLVHDGSGILYAPDPSGVSNYLFRFNPEGVLNTPGGQIGDDVPTETLEELVVSAWYSDPQLSGGSTFGVTGIAVAGQQLSFVREDDSSNLFNVAIHGVRPENSPLENTSIEGGSLSAPFGLAAAGSGRFVVSSRDSDELLLLEPNNGVFDVITLFDSDDDSSFIAPASIVVRGDDILVVGSQFNQLGSVQQDTAKIFRVQRP